MTVIEISDYFGGYNDNKEFEPFDVSEYGQIA